MDDEDGVLLFSPLGPGAPATFEVTVTNTTGSPAYLQAFMDFNRDGDFTDPGEQFVSRRLVPSGTVGTLTGTVDRHRSRGVTGRQHLRTVPAQPDDRIWDQPVSHRPVKSKTSRSRSSYVPKSPTMTSSPSRETHSSNQLDVLANDFQTVDNQLTIENLNTTGTAGRWSFCRRSENRSSTRRPTDSSAAMPSATRSSTNLATAAPPVVVNVSFQSNIPIALDDTFEVPQGSVNRALNVLDNDVPSTFGGISITSVTPGSAGGHDHDHRRWPVAALHTAARIQWHRAVHLQHPGCVGSTSSATVTVNLLPGSRSDDIVDFTIGIFDPVNINTPITNVQVGDEFLVRVSVDDLRKFANPEGVASAFLDLLYTDELVATLNTDNNPNFPFDIIVRTAVHWHGGSCNRAARRSRA